MKLLLLSIWCGTVLPSLLLSAPLPPMSSLIRKTTSLTQGLDIFVTKMSVCDTDDGEVQKTISLTQGLDNMINVYKTDDGKNTGQLSSRCLCSTHSKAPFFSFHMASSVSSRLYNQLPNLRYKWLRTNDKHTASIIILKNHQGAVSIGRINNFLNTEEIDPTSVSR